MADQFIDQIAEDAMKALRGDDPVVAAQALSAMLKQNPERIDLIHALAVTELRMGEAESAYALTLEGERVANLRRDAVAGTVMPQLMLVRAAACEDRYDPAGAEAAFKALLEKEEFNPRGRSGLAHLYLGWGRIDEATAELDGYLDDGADEQQYIEAQHMLNEAVKKAVREDVHPKEWLNAHRGAYCEMFDHYAAQMAEKGWIAEAARMTRTDDGDVVNSIPEGARDYAAVRVDLVDPNTGQGGRVGDQPMVVALEDHEPLAQAPVLISWPERDHPFGVYVSTQCPWNHMRVTVRFVDGIDGGDLIDDLDPVIGDWYTAGFEGAFGTADAGRFHEIDDPMVVGDDTVVYHLDMGRAETSAVPDLLRRLLVLHGRRNIRSVVLGRGYAP
jgi:hypothetical protein